MIDDTRKSAIKRNPVDYELKKLELQFYISYKSITLDYLIEEVIPTSNKEIIKVNNEVKIEFNFRIQRNKRKTRKIRIRM